MTLEQAIRVRMNELVNEISWATGNFKQELQVEYNELEKDLLTILK